MKKDFSGDVYGYIKVLKKTNKKDKNGNIIYLCKCNNCGKEFENSIVNYRAKKKKNAKIITCGCYDRHFCNFYKNGLSKTKLRYIYDHMKSRCYNKNNKSYKNYGGRGIKVCDEWLDKEKGFENFYNWSINNNYSKNLTIDRIDNDGNYEPINCRWTTFEEQINNRRTTTFLEYNGIKKPLTQFAREYKIPIGTLRARIKRGWTLERALTEKKHNNYKGKHSKGYYKYNNLGEQFER